LLNSRACTFGCGTAPGASMSHRASRYVTALAKRAKFASSVFELAIFYIVKRGLT